MIVDTKSQLRSPTSVGVTMLLLAATACVPAAVIGAAEWLMHEPAPILGASMLVIFFAVFVTCIILAFRRAGTPTERATLTPVTDVVGRKSAHDSSANGQANGQANGKPAKRTSRRTRA